MIRAWLQQPVREAVRALATHPLRSALIAATFAVGLASVLVVIGAVEGGRQAIVQTLNSLGIDVIAALNPLQLDQLPGLKIGAGGDRLIDNPAIAELEAKLGAAVANVVPLRIELVQVRCEAGVSSNTLIATRPEFQELIKVGLVAGRFLTADDRFVPGQIANAVLDEALAQTLHGGPLEELIGQEFRGVRNFKPLKIRVVGILRDPILLRKHMNAFSSQSRARELTAKRLEFLNVYVLYEPELDTPSGVLVQVNDPRDVDVFGPRLAEFFDVRGILPYYHVQKRWIASVIKVVETFSLLANFIWILNLCVVLVVTATITTLAIDERFSEIAILRVEGASVVAVVSALLAEGTLLVLVALAPGYALAELIATQYVKPILDWTPEFPAWTHVGAPLLLLVTGLLCYAIPARRVARLDPARALGEYAE
ncbi:MAG: ABC transporter permease [Planctomycetota bacterium]